MKKILCFAAAGAGFLAILLLLIAGPLYRTELLTLGTAFLFMRWAAYVGIAAIILVVIAGIVLRPSARSAQALLVASFVTGLVAFYLPYSQLQTAQSVPRIHDITTDTQNPPAFVAIAPLRADSPNPVEYPGEETAEQQRQAYPDIETMRLPHPPQDVFASALDVVEASGWELVEANANDGRIEATATTTWFGFKDDVVIRITGEGSTTLLDVRSKSRLGGSDVGANAERIRKFRDDLLKRLD
ncbi:MAG: DUF1499 domain-containing protein [Idiomarina sp.]|nr:DUF1499 domain-containing protein [Idiomarina sp.]